MIDEDKKARIKELLKKKKEIREVTIDASNRIKNLIEISNLNVTKEEAFERIAENAHEMAMSDRKETAAIGRLKKEIDCIILRWKLNECNERDFHPVELIVTYLHFLTVEMTDSLDNLESLSKLFLPDDNTAIEDVLQLIYKDIKSRYPGFGKNIVESNETRH